MEMCNGTAEAWGHRRAKRRHARTQPAALLACVHRLGEAETQLQNMPTHLTQKRNAPLDTTQTAVPASAAWLGGLGAIPFVTLAGAIPLLDGAPRLFAVHALLAYGATILSFLGGVHWGLAIRGHSGPDTNTLRGRLILSVIPSLAGWAALLVTGPAGLLILAIAIAGMLLVDLRAARLGDAPPWYPKLRVPLSGVVIAALLVGALL
jgi:hypothetical protein